MQLNKIYQGDALDILKTLPSESVDMIMTSPPYWNLRDYGVNGQLGLEETYQEYINNLWNIFDEVKRVLKKEGTCWVVIGDTYNGNKKGKTDNKVSDYLKNTTTKLNKKRGEMPDKCLLQIPNRFAIEMCNRGWILRNEIIWHKPNCMPSSVKDRFTVDFEKIFFFVKNKKYYFETQYEEMKTKDTTSPRGSKGVIGQQNAGRRKQDMVARNDYTGFNDRYTTNENLLRNKRTVWSITTKPFKESHFAVFPEDLIETPIKAGCPENGIVLDLFMGSGTTAVVCKKNNRNYLGIELNPEYIEIAEKRISKANYQIKLF